jgi:hypothetical protein
MMRSMNLRATAGACILALTLIGCGQENPPEGNYFNILTLHDMLVITNVGSYVQTFEASMNITAARLNDLPGATGTTTIWGPAWTNFSGKLVEPDARVPAVWRVQANSGACKGQHITEFVEVKRGDTIYAWCHIQQQITVPSQSFNGDGDVIDQVCCFTDTLFADSSLNVGDYITSQDGRFSLALLGNGELAIFNNTAGSMLWSTYTGGQISQAYMQADGNFVGLNGSGAPVWATNTGIPGSFLIMQDDGNLVVYTPWSLAQWSSGTCCY